MEEPRDCTRCGKSCDYKDMYDWFPIKEVVCESCNDEMEDEKANQGKD